MPKIEKLWNPARLKQSTNARNVGLVIFAVVVLAIGWSGAKAVQKNYQLQKQIALLKQQNEILRLSNENTALQNKYYETDQFLELAARRNFGLAAPGETVLLVPKAVALKYVDPEVKEAADKGAEPASPKKSRISQNLDDWRDFLLGRRLFED